jgi:hypothetical protein
VRVAAATALTNWLATDPTATGDPDILLIGDYNSYALEDPITTLRNAGFTNLIATLIGPDAYSYVFDGQWGYLDHALGSPSLVPQVKGVAEYHINADEPSVLDYNTDFKTANLQTSLYAADQYRISDHDPVVVGLSPNAAPTVSAGGPYTVFAGYTVSVRATGSDPEGRPLTYAWDLDDNGTFETPGQDATFSAASIGVPGPRTIRVRVTDSGGLTAVAQATVNVVVTYDSLCRLTTDLVTKKGVEKDLCKKLDEAERADAKGKVEEHDKKLDEYRQKLDHETGKAVSAADAALLTSLSRYL